MLARNFKTNIDLGITEPEHAALIKVLGMLERGELVHCRRPPSLIWDEVEPGTPFGFNMQTQGIRKPCGTVGCIGGWVAFMLGMSPAKYVNAVEDGTGSLHELYWGHTDSDTTPAQAAAALRNYLAFGRPNWNDVINGD